MFFKFQFFWERSNQILEVLSKNLCVLDFEKENHLEFGFCPETLAIVSFETEFGAHLELWGVTKQSLREFQSADP